jgi:hypothetical protein
MFLFTLCGVCLYNLIENELLLRYKKNLVYNYTSCMHIIFVVILYGLKQSYDGHILQNLFILNTTGYFINDILFIIKNRKFKMKDIVYLYHHFFSSLCLIYKPENSNAIIWLFWAEISNIPGHIVYHYIKTDNKTFTENKIKNCCEKFQVFLYGIIRVFYLTLLAYNEIDIPKNKLQDLLFKVSLPLVVMGWFYTYILLKKNYFNNNNEDKKRIE